MRKARSVSATTAARSSPFVQAASGSARRLRAGGGHSIRRCRQFILFTCCAEPANLQHRRRTAGPQQGRYRGGRREPVGLLQGDSACTALGFPRSPRPARASPNETGRAAVDQQAAKARLSGSGVLGTPFPRLPLYTATRTCTLPPQGRGCRTSAGGAPPPGPTWRQRPAPPSPRPAPARDGGATAKHARRR